jgi:ribosomal protein S18 acetylase RimI-like enzyme
MPAELLAATSEIVLREAVVTDAEAIFSLKKSAFGDTYLQYTIYQTRQSLEFLRSLIAVQKFVVAERDSRIIGYYNAVPHDGYLFINYIAVGPEAASQGVGTMLIHSCAAKAGQVGCIGIELDVFASNRRAIHWYERIGFELVNDVYLYRVCLRNIPRSPIVPVVASDELERALSEEQRQGFSKLTCRYMEQELLVGLIAAHTCKLLENCNTLTDHESIGAIAALFPDRSYLILSSHRPPPAALPVVTYERSIRMRKLLV